MRNEDWVEVELGEICQINMGQSPPSSTYNTERIGLPFFQGKAEFTELHPVVEKWCSEPTKIAEPNDILLSVRAPVGATNVANEKCAIGRGLAAISYKYDYKYILYFLRLIEKKLDSQGTGTTFRAISGAILKSQIIPFSPLTIQRAIVRKIETLFTSLDKGIADLKTAQGQLKVYRQAVLKKAFEGGFTHKKVKEGELPEGWTWVKLGEVLEKPKYGTSKKCDYNNGKTAVLRIPNISNGFIDDNDLKYASFNQTEINDYSLREGDLLTIRSNGSVDLVGKCALIKHKDTNYLYAGYLIRLRPVKDYLYSPFLLYLMSSIDLRVQIETFSKSTSGVNNINSGELSNLKIPLPPTLPEQHAIVREIESRLSVCDKVEQNLIEALEKAEALRQSILKKAFEGKLLSEAEIAQCRQEADYEPASQLLERIK